MKNKGTIWVTKLIDSNGNVAAVRCGKLFRKAWSVDGKDASEFYTKCELHIPKANSYEVINVK